MTHLLVVATISEQSAFTFGSEVETWARRHLPYVLLLDLDAQSDRGYVIQIAEAMNRAEAVALWVECKDEKASPGAVTTLVETLLRHPQKKLMLLNGRHAMLGRFSNRTDLEFRGGEAACELQQELLRFFTDWKP